MFCEGIVGGYLGREKNNTFVERILILLNYEKPNTTFIYFICFQFL